MSMLESKRDKVIVELAQVINRNSLENLSNTPDFILAEYLMVCLEAYSTATKCSEGWFSRQITTVESLSVNDIYRICES